MPPEKSLPVIHSLKIGVRLGNVLADTRAAGDSTALSAALTRSILSSQEKYTSSAQHEESKESLFECAYLNASAASHTCSLVDSGIQKPIAVRRHADSASWAGSIAGTAAAAFRIVLVEYGDFLFHLLFGLLRGRIDHFFKTPYARDFTRRRSMRSLGVAQYLAISLSLAESSFMALA